MCTQKRLYLLELQALLHPQYHQLLQSFLNFYILVLNKFLEHQHFELLQWPPDSALIQRCLNPAGAGGASN